MGDCGQFKERRKEMTGLKNKKRLTFGKGKNGRVVVEKGREKDSENKLKSE